MRKLILTSISIMLITSVWAQKILPMVMDDIIYFEMDSVYTIYPLSNDYNPEGLILEIESFASSNGISILSNSDTSIVCSVTEYFFGANNERKIYYKLKSEEYNMNASAYIKLVPKDIIKHLSINKIKAAIFPQNVQFYDAYFGSNRNVYSYPADSNTNTMFSFSLWIGGHDDHGDLHLAAERYRQGGTDFWSGPLTDDGLALSDSANAEKWFRSWKVKRSEIIDHIENYQDPNYQIPIDIESWPAHGEANQSENLAPFVDVDLDAVYHPENGDYPLIKGDESIFFIYNDHLFHTETGGEALGVEIHCMAWAFENIANKEAYSSTIFLSYKFFNRSLQTYYDSYIGSFADIAIGNFMNDYIGTHVSNGNIYAYNGVDEDPDYIFPENDTTYGYGTDIPAQAVCILGGPHMDADQIDNPIGECDESINGLGFGDGIIDNEQYGMNRSVFFHVGSQYTDPLIAPEYYHNMSGFWENGSPIGGDNPIRFIYPGDSDPCYWWSDGLNLYDTLWTEETSHHNPGDRRGVASMGPFTFEAGSVEYLDVALVTAPGDQEINSKDLLQDYVAAIRADYLKNPEEFGNQYLGNEEISQKAEEGLQLFPNPVNGNQFYIQLPVAEKGEYFIYNSTGQRVQNGVLAAQKQQQIDIVQLDDAWYVLEVKIKDKTYRTKLIK